MLSASKHEDLVLLGRLAVDGSRLVVHNQRKFHLVYRDCVAIPFMVREPHHERDFLIANSIAYPFALSLSKGSERIATQSLQSQVEVANLL